MPVNSIAVTQELYTLFGENPLFMNDEHYELFVEIACFLGDESNLKYRKALVTAFEELEQTIQQTKSDGKSRLQKAFMNKGWEKDRDSHLLSSTLTHFERTQGGFNALPKNKPDARGSERARLYLSFVRADRFRHLLTTGYHWKDPTVSPEHGEFTHRLQWYALVAAGVLDRGTAVSVMSKCGTYIRNAPPANQQGQRVASTDLWEVLFDRDSRGSPNAGFLYPSVDSDLDFRNPNNLNNFLMKNVKLPFLSSFLTARFKKRKPQDLKTYVAKKKFGKTVDQLSESERITLYGIILDGVAGGGDADFFAKKIAMQIDVEEGSDNVPDLSTIKKVIDEDYPIPYE